MCKLVPHHDKLVVQPRSSKTFPIIRPVLVSLRKSHLDTCGDDRTQTSFTGWPYIPIYPEYFSGDTELFHHEVVQFLGTSMINNLHLLQEIELVPSIVIGNSARQQLNQMFLLLNHTSEYLGNFNQFICGYRSINITVKNICILHLHHPWPSHRLQFHHPHPHWGIPHLYHVLIPI